MRLRHQGVTFIEIILSVAVIAVIAASAQPFLSGFLLRNNMTSVQDSVISTLRKAQQYSMDGKDNASWGACRNTAGTLIRLYRGGTCNAPTVSENFSVPSNITVSAFDVTFSKLRGEPSSAISVSITSSIDSRSISVNLAGGMTIPNL